MLTRPDERAVPGTPTSVGPCHVCGAAIATTVERYEDLTRVTSDCKTWPAGGRLCQCDACGTVQKVLDASWQRDVSEIYGAYTIYFQSDGAEQAVFGSGTGQATLRSDQLVQEILRHVRLPDVGRMLDVGCGNGAFLRAFSRAVPGWRLAGTELSTKYRDVVEAIPGVEELYLGMPKDVPGRFALVSLIHALEHIPAPVAALAQIRDKLEDDGLLFVEVPDCDRNPFDLLVADHSSHFTLQTLQAVIEAAGFEIVAASRDWIPKELSILCRPGTTARPLAKTAARDIARSGVNWLLQLRDEARRVREAAAGGSFGLFGSSIAATWVATELHGAAAFFVDEDPHREGSRFMDRAIVKPSDVPPGSHVFIPLGGDLARRVAARLAAAFPSVHWYAAPPLSSSTQG